MFWNGWASPVVLRSSMSLLSLSSPPMAPCFGGDLNFMGGGEEVDMDAGDGLGDTKVFLGTLDMEVFLDSEDMVDRGVFVDTVDGMVKADIETKRK